jgi:hypothetical protein
MGCHLSFLSCYFVMIIIPVPGQDYFAVAQKLFEILPKRDGLLVTSHTGPKS